MVRGQNFASLPYFGAACNRIAAAVADRAPENEKRRKYTRCAVLLFSLSSIDFARVLLRPK